MTNTDARPPVLILVLAISIIVFAMSGCSRGPEANANINTNINTNTSTVANTTRRTTRRFRAVPGCTERAYAEFQRKPWITAMVIP